MSAEPIDVNPRPDFGHRADPDVRVRLDRVRLQLLDSAHDLRLLPTEKEAATRIHSVALDLVRAMEELRLVQHIMQLEETGLAETLESIDRDLGEGWVPEGHSAEDFVERLRQAINN